VLHNGMPYDPIHGQGHRGLKCVKMADFKGYLLCQYACNQKNQWWIMILQDNIWILIAQIVDIRPCLASRDHLTKGIPPLANAICRTELTGCPVCIYLFIFMCLLSLRSRSVHRPMKRYKDVLIYSLKHCAQPTVMSWELLAEIRSLWW